MHSKFKTTINPRALQLTRDSPHTQVYVFGLFALISFIIVKYIAQTTLSPLYKVPGPFLARFTRLWEFQAFRKHEWTTFNIALHEKYGPIVRLAPNRYSINDVEAAKIILGHRNGLNKSPFYSAYSSLDESNLFAEPSTSAHAKIRRPMAQLYSTTTLLAYEPFVDNCNTILLKRIDEYAKDGKSLDVRELLQYYAFDVIGEITVGSRFGLLEENGDKSGIINAMDESIQYSSLVSLIPPAHWWMIKVSNLLGIETNFTKITSFVNKHLGNRVAGKTKCPEDRMDFLARMLPLEQEGKATRYHTRQACTQNISAGSDTTAIAISTVIAYLAMCPDKLSALRQELDEAMNSREMSDSIIFQKTQQLPYLQAVILEALRIHPAVAILLARVVGEAGLHVAGQYFPPGTELGVNPWVIHHSKDVFGTDASEFRPERWLTDSPEERARLERNFLTFSHGPRTCIGRNITMLEMSTLIPRIVRSYDFELLVDEETGEKYTWRTRTFAKPSFKCLVKRRPI